jgi:hypothetical protein
MPVTDSPAAAIQDHLPAAPTAQAGTRTREDSPGDGGAWTARFAWAQRWAGGLLSGESLAYRQPPSLAQEWERHKASAQHYNAGLLRGSRYLWGLACLPISALEMVIRWVRSSPPLLVVTVVTLYLIHQFA